MSFQLIVSVVVLFTSVYLAVNYYFNRRYKTMANKFFSRLNQNWKPKSRKDILKNLKTREYDILVIGGGATGLGVAVDAITRGLNVALVESEDFGSGTSSKCTKLLHGGIRYLEKAFNNIDFSQFQIVYDGLRERRTIIDSCPFLTSTLDIMFPIYKKILVPYYLIGLKFYDWMSGRRSLGQTRYLNYSSTIDNFPHIRKKNLIGSIVYKDGQFFDYKFSVLLAVTAAYYGADVINHVKVVDLLTESNGKITGAKCLNKLNNEEFSIKSKIVINCTGQFADKIRNLPNSNYQNILTHSIGSHIVVSNKFAPKKMGFVDPDTSDGRIAFFLPYKGKTLIGGTDEPCDVTSNIKPSRSEFEFLIHEANFYTDNKTKMTKEDILSIWSGVRPLIKGKEGDNTEKIVRKHVIKIEDNNLVTVTGGKWVIYRLMAEQTLNKVINHFKLNVKRPCITNYLKIVGSQDYNSKTHELIQNQLDVPKDIAIHLSTSYGSKSLKIRKFMKNGVKRILPEYPYIEEEILYSIENEFACKISDILFNRLGLSYIDCRKACDIIEIVGRKMKNYFKWTEEKLQEEISSCYNYLETVGYSLITNDFVKKCTYDEI